ncbi:MAG TPA: F0F1 ATP synthase subunit delta [bacterium]|nr:F0F1 ATP synthase subunit delta [bacterium]
MKIKPEIYAKSLLAALEEGKDRKVIAKNFWEMLEKNKQRKDLDAIFAILEREFAQKEGKALVSVESNHDLTNEELANLTKFTEKKLGKKPMFKIVVKPELVGVVLKYNDTVLDTTLNSKLERLKQVLAK